MRHNADIPGHLAVPEAPNGGPANKGPEREQDPLSDANIKRAIVNAVRKVESKGRRHIPLDVRERDFEDVPLSNPDRTHSDRRQQRSQTADQDDEWEQITANDAPHSSYNSQADHKWKYDEELQSEQPSETNAIISQGQGYVGSAKNMAAWGLGRVNSGFGMLLRTDSKEPSKKPES